MSIDAHEVSQSLERNVVHEDCPAVGIRLIKGNVIFGEEN